MNSDDLAINNDLIKEFGFDIDEDNKLYDTDTGELLKIKGKTINAPGIGSNKLSTEFDPMNNIKMMNALFGKFLNTLQSTGEINGCVISYDTTKLPSGKMVASVKIDPNDGNPIQEVKSGHYNNETSCYAELVYSLNGNTINIHDYDEKKKGR